MRIRPVGTELFHADGQTREVNRRFRNFAKAPKNIYLLLKVQSDYGAHVVPCSVRIAGFFLWRLNDGGMKLEIRPIVLSLKMSESSYNSPPPFICLHGEHRDTFSFIWLITIRPQILIKCKETIVFFPMAQQPLGGLGGLIFRGFTITLRHTTLGRTPLDEWPARCRDLYLTTHNTHKRQTSMPYAGFEPTIPVSERPQTHALDRAATGIGKETCT
jgi:hypothetical protein